MFCLPKLLHLRCCCCSGLLLLVLPPLFRGLTCQSRNIQVHFKVVKLNISEWGKIIFWKFQPGTHQTYLNLTHLGSSEHPTFNIDENHHLKIFTWPGWVKIYNVKMGGRDQQAWKFQVETFHFSLLMVAGGVCNDGTRAGYFHDTNVTKQGKKVESNLQLLG